MARFLDGAGGLLGGGPQERIVGREQKPARVDQLEGRALPRDLGVVAVARGAGPAVGDGLPPPADPVEKRGLADVGASDERDLGNLVQDVSFDSADSAGVQRQFDSYFGLTL
jgi:hypothetical protein